MAATAYRIRDGAWHALPSLPGDPIIDALVFDPRRGALFLGADGVWTLSGARRRRGAP